MLDFICTFILLYIVVSIIWPRLGSSRVANDRKHRELLRALAKLERPTVPAPNPSPLPTFNSVERARLLALGRIRDGEKRHPILDAPRERCIPSKNQSDRLTTTRPSI
jgi:hypothetical protein